MIRYALEPEKLADVHVLTFEAGERILQQGVSMDSLYLVVSGNAKLCVNGKNGKNLILCYCVSEGILGDVELMLDDDASSTTVTALSAFRCVVIPFARNKMYLRQNVPFMNLIAKGLAEKLLDSSSAHVTSVLYTSEERLCSYILMMERNGVFADVMADAAQSVGMSYRHVFRVMNSLCREGILKKEPFGYRILNRELLQKKSAEGISD